MCLGDILPQVSERQRVPQTHGGGLWYNLMSLHNNGEPGDQEAMRECPVGRRSRESGALDEVKTQFPEKEVQGLSVK